MRWLVLAIVLRASVAFACNDPDEPCEEGPYRRWSWAPLVGAQVSYAANVHTQALLSGELRLRHGTFHDPDVVTASLRVTSVSFGTIEPAVIIGYDFVSLPYGYADGYRLAQDTRVAFGAGRSYGDANRTFALAQLSVGSLWQREDGQYLADCGEQGECMLDLRRHDAQVDLVLEVRVASDGDVRLSFGVDVDPLRLWRALASF